MVDGMDVWIQYNNDTVCVWRKKNSPAKVICFFRKLFKFMRILWNKLKKKVENCREYGWKQCIK